MSLEIRVIPKKDFDDSDSHGYYYVDESGKGIVNVPQGASTRSKLHEVGHHVLGHTEKVITIKDLTFDEIAAEAFAFRSMNKKPTWKVAIPVLREVVQGYYVNPSEAFNLAIEGLKNSNINISKSDRSSLWNVCVGLNRVLRNTRVGESLKDSSSSRLFDALNE